jgi:hypothetical protein|eukprot:scaffold6415_cov145-Isochrysis_galbana.AAC.1
MSTSEVPYAIAYPSPYSHLAFVFASPSPHTIESLALVTQFDGTPLPAAPPFLPLPPPLPKQPWPTLTWPQV